MITTFYPPYSFGGDAVFVQHLGRALARRGHDVHVIHCLDSHRSMARGPAPTPQPDEPGITVHGLHSRVGALSPLATQQTGLPWFKGRKIRAVLDGGDFDVVHFHNLSLVGGPSAMRYGGAAVKLYTTHEHWLVCPTHVLYKNRREPCVDRSCFRCQLAHRRPPQLWRYSGLLRRSARHVDAFLAPTAWTARRHQADGFDVPLVHLPPFLPEAPAAESDPVPGLPERPYFLFVGRLETIKGLQTILPVFRRYEQADLVIAGDGEQAAELRALAGDCPRIHFVGLLSPAQVQRAITGALALVVPSLTYEVFPMVLLEAHRAGTPAIVRDLGALPEIVGTAGSGLLFRDDASLILALEELRTDPARRAQLGEAARRAFLAEWSEEIHLQRYLELVERLRAGRTVRPRAAPLLGHALPFLADKLGFLTRACASPESVVELDLGGRTLVLKEPEDVQHVLETNHANYDKSRRIGGRRGRQLFGAGLLTAESGPSHLQRRRTMQPAFHRRVLSGFVKTISDTVRDSLAQWKDEATRDVEAEMLRLTQRVMGRLLFGVDYANQAAELGAAVAARHRYFEYLFGTVRLPGGLAVLLPSPDRWPAPAVLRHRQALRRIDRAIFEFIRERREAADPPADLLTLLMQASHRDGSRLADVEVRDEALTLSVTGYETIGVALAWTLDLLAEHPAVMARLRTEVDEVLGDREPSVDDLPRLRYADMVLAEALRLYPPTWLYVREAKHADLLPSGARVTPGTKLYLSPYLLQRDPRHFEDPARFDPERFAPEQRAGRPKYAYFPFGGGPRLCIGQGIATMEGVITLAAIARGFEWERVPGQTIEPEPGLTLRPRNGIRMRVRER